MNTGRVYQVPASLASSGLYLSSRDTCICCKLCVVSYLSVPTFRISSCLRKKSSTIVGFLLWDPLCSHIWAPWTQFLTTTVDFSLSKRGLLQNSLIQYCQKQNACLCFWSISDDLTLQVSSSMQISINISESSKQLAKQTFSGTNGF